MTKSKGIGRGNNPNSHIGHKNLIPCDKRPLDQVKEMSRKGKAPSKAAMIKKKEVQTFAEAFLKGDASKWSPEEVKDFCAINGVTCTLENAMNARAALKALIEGDMMAYNLSMTRMCGAPIQRLEQTLTIKSDVKLNEIKKRIADDPSIIDKMFGEDVEQE